MTRSLLIDDICIGNYSPQKMLNSFLSYVQLLILICTYELSKHILVHSAHVFWKLFTNFSLYYNCYHNSLRHSSIFYLFKTFFWRQKSLYTLHSIYLSASRLKKRSTVCQKTVNYLFWPQWSSDSHEPEKLFYDETSATPCMTPEDRSKYQIRPYPQSCLVWTSIRW